MLSHLHRTDTVLLFIVDYPSVWELGSVQKFAPLCSSCYFATLYVYEAFVFGSSLLGVWVLHGMLKICIIPGKGLPEYASVSSTMLEVEPCTVGASVAKFCLELSAFGYLDIIATEFIVSWQSLVQCLGENRAVRT